MTNWFDANPFLNFYEVTPGRFAYHEGADLNLNVPTWDADSDKPVYAIGDGVVTYSQLVPAPSTWGRKVVIRHKLPDGSIIHSRYAHLRTLAVQVGDIVLRGRQIGTVGGTEYGFPNHLHFAISHSGILETNPTHWPGTNREAVVANYVNPKAWLQVYNPPVLFPTEVSFGIHDEDGAKWMLANQVKGPSLHSIVLKAPTPIDFTRYADAGIRVYLRLNWDYHPNGTLPGPDRPQEQLQFVNACITTITESKGVAGWIIGNEFNNPAEHPDGKSLSPTYVAKLYNGIWGMVPLDKPVSIGAIDPYFGPSHFPFPDNRKYWSDLLQLIDGIDFFNLHPKTQDSRPELVNSNQTFTDPPLIGAYQHLNSYKQLLELIPAKYRSRPVVLSEVNPQRKAPGGVLGWNADLAAAWIEAAAANVTAWNNVSGTMKVQEVIFYRWSFDEWALQNIPAALNTVKNL